MELSPGGIIAWIIVGLIAGWAASTVSRGHGYGLIGDIIVGLVARSWAASWPAFSSTAAWAWSAPSSSPSSAPWSCSSS